MEFSFIVLYCVALCISKTFSVDFHLHDSNSDHSIIKFFEEPEGEQTNVHIQDHSIVKFFEEPEGEQTNVHIQDNVITEGKWDLNPKTHPDQEDHPIVVGTSEDERPVVTTDNPPKTSVHHFYQDIFCEPIIKTVVYGPDSTQCYQKSKNLCIKSCTNAFRMCRHRALCYLEHALSVSTCEKSCGDVIKNLNVFER